MPCTLWNNTTIITYGRIKMDTLYLVSVFITDNLNNLTAQEKNVLRTLWMPVDRNNGSWQQGIQHTLRIIIGRCSQIEILTQSRINNSLLKELT